MADPEGAPLRSGQQDPPWVRALLIGLAAAMMGLMVGLPVACVFWRALEGGPGRYLASLLAEPDTRAAILMTLTVAPLAVLANAGFGLAAAWCIARFRFPGRALLLTLLDLPFAVSPVVAGLVFLMALGLRGPLGPFLAANNVQILFAWPGLVLATVFVTIPFVARELIPLMEALGSDEEVAARSLGASGWQMFWLVTLPNIRWGLLYGLILSNARAMGEFGAAAVVSGHIAGETETMPLHIERLFQDYNTTASFAVASLLTLLALATLAAKSQLEAIVRRQRRAARDHALAG